MICYLSGFTTVSVTEFNTDFFHTLLCPIGYRYFKSWWKCWVPCLFSLMVLAFSQKSAWSYFLFAFISRKHFFLSFLDSFIVSWKRQWEETLLHRHCCYHLGLCFICNQRCGYYVVYLSAAVENGSILVQILEAELLFFVFLFCLG